MLTKRKATKKGLDELRKVMPVLSENEQRGCIGRYGAGTYCDPFTYEQFDSMTASGTWTGGFVQGLSGFVSAQTIIFGGSTNPNGFSSQHFSSFADLIRSQSITGLNALANVLIGAIPIIGSGTQIAQQRRDAMMNEMMAQVVEQGHGQAPVTITREYVPWRNSVTYTIFNAATGERITSKTLSLPSFNWH